MRVKRSLYRNMSAMLFDLSLDHLTGNGGFKAGDFVFTASHDSDGNYKCTLRAFLKEWTLTGNKLNDYIECSSICEEEADLFIRCTHYKVKQMSEYMAARGEQM